MYANKFETKRYQNRWSLLNIILKRNMPTHVITDVHLRHVSLNIIIIVSKHLNETSWKRMDQQRSAIVNKMLSYRRETALQGALQFSPKVEDWNWETIFYGHYRSIFNHCDINGLKICRIPWKKRKIRAITAFKVIQGRRGRYQSKARMRFAVSD